MADIPGASIYGQAALQAKTAYQNALARINQQRGSTMRSFGYSGDFDEETGVLKNMKVDPYNQYGGYQQMLKSHAENADQMRDTMMDRGLSAKGGLGAQYERQAQWEFGKDSQNLGTQFADSLFQMQDAQNQAKYDYDSALWQAQLEAARNAYNEGDFTDTGYGGDYSDPEYTPPVPEGPWPAPPGAQRPGTVKPKTNWTVPKATKKPTKNRTSGNPMQRGGRGSILPRGAAPLKSPKKPTQKGRK